MPGGSPSSVSAVVRARSAIGEVRASALVRRWRRGCVRPPPTGWQAIADPRVQGVSLLNTTGERRGAYFPAGVLTGLTTELTAAREELFDPVAMVFPAADEEDAVRIANDTPCGLGSYVLTTDPAQEAHPDRRLTCFSGNRKPC
ncbi:aldehyde dehydrogenase family protein [Streptomyces sp. NPDC005963]|uniref:aldehyde dehydrogenase family protein n=1 Tax=Streptomyces sp. NPDC005963 TaxID=3156721 RepID=UPI0033D473A5